MFSKENIRHTKTKGYYNLAKEAYFKYPNAPLKRLEHVKENGTTKDINLYLLDMLTHLTGNNEFVIDNTSTHNLIRALCFAVDYMQRDLSEEAYEYINKKIIKVFENIEVLEKAIAN